METRNQNNKRKRKFINREPVLVRSVKPGQASVVAWERNSQSSQGLWRNNSAA